MGTLECPACCSEQFYSRAELLQHLEQLAVLLNNLACTLCNESFLTLQDHIEHLRYECVDADGNKIPRENRHITFVDCGAFCTTSVSEQMCEPEKKILKYVKINRKNIRASESDKQEQFVVPCNLLANSIQETILGSPEYTILAGNEDQEMIVMEQVPEEKVEVISLPPHLIEVSVSEEPPQMIDYHPFSPSDDHFEPAMEEEEVVHTSKTLKKSKVKPKKVKKKSKKQMKIEIPTIAMVLYPKPEDQRVKITQVACKVGPKEVIDEKEEMLVGTEEEALAANVNPLDIIYKCSHCNTLFPLKADYDKHCCLIRCEICMKTFKSINLLETHKKLHGREAVEQLLETIEIKDSNKFYCEKCNDNFSCDLKDVHTRIHDENLSIFKCDKCDHIYISVRDLVWHTKSMHKHAKYRCEVCGKRCCSEANLRNHTATHTGIKPHKCKYCDKRFKRTGDKNKHERVHTGEKPNVCEVCGKSFRVNCSLRLHMRTHTNERPYICIICSKTFKSHSSLSFHTKSHGEDRPYKCPYCEKAFKTLNALHGHRNSHNKPFKCDVCERSFSVRNAMLKHQERMHQNIDGRDKFDCVVCGASYGRAWSLEVHLKTHGKLGQNSDTTLLKQMVAMGSVLINKSPTDDMEVEPNAVVIKRTSRVRKKKQTLDL